MVDLQQLIMERIRVEKASGQQYEPLPKPMLNFEKFEENVNEDAFATVRTTTPSRTYDPLDAIALAASMVSPVVVETDKKTSTVTSMPCKRKNGFNSSDDEDTTTIGTMSSRSRSRSNSITQTESPSAKRALLDPSSTMAAPTPVPQPTQTQAWSSEASTFGNPFLCQEVTTAATTTAPSVHSHSEQTYNTNAAKAMFPGAPMSTFVPGGGQGASAHNVFYTRASAPSMGPASSHTSYPSTYSAPAISYHPITMFVPGRTHPSPYGANTGASSSSSSSSSSNSSGVRTQPAADHHSQAQARSEPERAGGDSGKPFLSSPPSPTLLQGALLPNAEMTAVLATSLRRLCPPEEEIKEEYAKNLRVMGWSNRGLTFPFEKFRELYSYSMWTVCMAIELAKRRTVEGKPMPCVETILEQSLRTEQQRSDNYKAFRILRGNVNVCRGFADPDSELSLDSDSTVHDSTVP
jgi:hypothetical protein